MSNFTSSTAVTASISVRASDANVVRRYYFGTQPLKVGDVSSYASAQLITEAHNQGWASDPNKGLWTWFELALLWGAPRTGDDPTDYIRRRGGELLTWKSHDVPLNKDWNTQHGKVFDSNSPLIQNLQPGNVIGVIACAQFGAWSLDARKGDLTIKGNLA